jgi:RNA polymerase sigma factor (TIGR02999 family)
MLSLLYSEMHRLAEQCRAEQPEPQSIGSTTLVGEACLSLLSERDRALQKRNDLLGAAAAAMRSVLVSHARSRAQREVVEFDSSALDQVVVAFESRGTALLALEDALQELAKFSPEMARAAELRLFAGLSMEEVAAVLGIPQRTLEREWAAARAWLYERIS